LIVSIFFVFTFFTNFKIQSQESLIDTTDFLQDNGKYLRYYVEPLSNLSEAVSIYYDSITSRDIETYSNLKDYKLLHLLPTLGYSTVTNSPIISYSSSQIVNYKQRKDDRKFQIEQIKIRKDQTLQNDLISLQHLYFKLFKQIDELNTRIKIQDIERQQFDINMQKYSNTEINTETFLNDKKQLLQSDLQIQNFKYTILETIANIEILIKRNLDYDIPALFTNFKHSSQ